MAAPTHNRKVFNTLKKEHQQVLLSIVFEAMNQTKAYQSAYPDSTEISARKASSLLLTKIDLQEAKQELLDELKEQSSVTFEWCANQLVEAVSSAKSEDKVDVSGIRGCINELNKMHGNHAADKIDHTTKGESLNSLSNDQLEARIAALSAKPQ